MRGEKLNIQLDTPITRLGIISQKSTMFTDIELKDLTAMYSATILFLEGRGDCEVVCKVLRGEQEAFERMQFQRRDE